MKTVWKYPIKSSGEQRLPMPRGATLLAVQVQRGTPSLWALVDPAAEKVARNISVVGTGWPGDDPIGPYVGTFQLDGGALVFHVFDDGEGVL